MENVHTKKFLKYNDEIIPKPEGLDYELVPGKVYDLLHNDGREYLQESNDFTFPKNHYLNAEETKFIGKCIDAFNNTTKLTTGVMLSGLKGSGKTLMAKRIAVDSKLPIIVVSPKVSASDIEPFFAQTDTPCCIIFDEIDKYWSTRYLLNFLDGVRPTCKKLVICTCNDEEEIDRYLNDRCSRIRYKRVFKGLSKEAVVGVINDVIEDTEHAAVAGDYLYSEVKNISYDNAIIFAEELRNHPEESFSTILEDLNITKNSDKQESSNKSHCDASHCEMTESICVDAG